MLSARLPLTVITLSLFAASLSAAPLELDSRAMQSIASRYSALVLKTYAQVSDESQLFQKSVREFTSAPSAQTHDAAKNQWKKFKQIYALTESYRFYGGPIDSPDRNGEVLMNAWPIDESYIDYVKDHPKAGIIQNSEKYKSLDQKSLIEANAKDGERNIATGFHAAEFLLWGQDFDLKFAGKRSFEDFIPSKNSQAARRAEYLNSVANLLVKQCDYLAQAWKSGAPYPVAFSKEPSVEIMRRILTGVTSLSADEMAGERMTVALEKNDQENEQDCFSDFTLTDLAANQKGITQVLAESGLLELFKKQDPKLASQIEKQGELALSLLQKIPAPFDADLAYSAPKSARKSIQNAIDALNKQSQLISKMAAEWSVHLNVQ